MRELREISEIVNGRSGKVVHEVTLDGQVYYGTTADAGNTDETVQFPSAVALLWRWTGDDAFRDEMYDFSVRAVRYAVGLDADGDGWPEGSGNVERPGMGQEKLDVAVYTIRGLRDLARSRGGRARRATRAGLRVLLVVRRGRALPRRSFHTGTGPTTDPAGNPGPSCDSVVSSVRSERDIFSLGNAVMAVAEGNFGRLAEQRHYTTANARSQLDPAVWEQPGAMPEMLPSPGFGSNLGKDFLSRSSVLQAWGAGRHGDIGRMPGRRVPTARGDELVVDAPTAGRHTLVVTVR